MKPTKHQRARHTALCMSDRQARRIRDGLTESQPGEQHGSSPATAADRRRVRLLSEMEDRRMLAELGLEEMPT